jgi:hypothetical protein
MGKMKPVASLMQSQWTKERNTPSGETIKEFYLDNTILQTSHVNNFILINMAFLWDIILPE